MPSTFVNSQQKHTPEFETNTDAQSVTFHFYVQQLLL